MTRTYSAEQNAYMLAKGAHDAATVEYKRRLAAAGWHTLADDCTTDEADAYFAKWDDIDRDIFEECGVPTAYRNLRTAETNLLEWMWVKVNGRLKSKDALTVAAALDRGTADLREHAASLALRLSA